MTTLPEHGRVACNLCFKGSEIEFDFTKRTDGIWRITCNPLAWGSQSPEIVVLGFSKGPTQAGALSKTLHDKIAYMGSRLNVGRILSHIGIAPDGTHDELTQWVNNAISDRNGRIHFASLIRCTVERFESKDQSWRGSGGGMLDKFISNDFGLEVAMNCTSKFLGKLPANTKLVIMFGLGSKMNYVKNAKYLFEKARGIDFTYLNDVAYTDGKITVVHVEHFASQGALIPNWLGKNNHERANLGIMSRHAVRTALNLSDTKYKALTTPTAPCNSTTDILKGINVMNEQKLLSRKITVTQGNIDNGHIYLRDIIDIFPDESIGGSNKTKLAKQLLTIAYEGVGKTKTDIDGVKIFLRERSTVKQFFKVKRFKAGDEVLITKTGEYDFEVKKA